MSPPPSNPKSIYIIGAQCTGKTTLLKALERFFLESTTITEAIGPPGVVTEVARTVLREINFKTADIRDSPTLSFDLQKRILKKQYEAESMFNGRWIISDRSAVDPVMYTRHLIGEDAVKDLLDTREWKILEERMRASVVIVCEAGATWLKDDGVRLMPEDVNDWMNLHNTFCGFLTERGIPFVVLSSSITDLETRIEFVISLWQGERSLPVIVEA